MSGAADAPLLERAIALLGEDELARRLKKFGYASEDLLYAWEARARPKQIAPEGDWRNLLWLAGRGFGKTLALCLWVNLQITRGLARHVALVAPTAADARDVLVEGPTGILAISHPANRPLYEPSKRRLTWPNGAIATTFSAEEPDRLRGPNFDAAACDELAAWEGDAFDMLQMALRLGSAPKCVIATTPRPLKIIRDLVKDPHTIVVRGSTLENTKLSQAYLDTIKSRYGGTRLERQEIYGEVLEDVAGALFSLSLFERDRVKPDSERRYQRVVVAVDPSGGSGDENDEQGIVVTAKGIDGHAYTLADVTVRMSPEGWGRQVIEAYLKHRADAIVYERNFGGDMVEHVIKTAAQHRGVTVRMQEVKASRAKHVRIEPCSALCEQGRHHFVGHFPELEDQLCGFTPEGYRLDDSPDRADAWAWGISKLMFPDYDVGAYVRGVQALYKHVAQGS